MIELLAQVEWYENWKSLAGIAVVVLYALGYLGAAFKKGAEKGKQRGQSGALPKPPRPAPPPRPPVARPPQPPTARPPQPVSLPRPEPPEPPPQPQPRPRPATPRRAPVIARRTVDPQPARPTGVESHVRKLDTSVGKKPVGHLEEHQLSHIEEHIGAPKAAGRRQHSQTEQLHRVLQNRRGLHAAVLLSEILAPPLALRDQHLEQ